LAEHHLHIVSFDVPSPPSYGGVIDVHFKVRALAALGVKVHLHCFQYGRAIAPDLAECCAEVHYYPRKLGKHQLFSGLPYVVVSRRSGLLMQRLLADRHPILFEGLHSCYYLNDPRLKDRLKLVRAHNVEHDYYASLAKAESSAFRRTYFLNEARKLQKFEAVLAHAQHILAISPKDEAYFARLYRNVEHVPAFHTSERVSMPTGLGEYALYHGALAVPENDQAALYLVREVFNGLGTRLIIAGSNASKELKREVARAANVELRENVGTEEIHRLVRDAQVNVLPTFQSTGIKLKLLLCLFTGRHVVCNTPMVEGTGLEDLCHVHDRPEAMRAAILQCMGREANGSSLERRTAVLEERFSNRCNADKIIRLLEGKEVTANVPEPMLG
jgi:glycosyltransferase involved in cell wall biosynthesis